MNKARLLFLSAALTLTLACQFLFPPAREAGVISECGGIITAIRGIQPTGRIPQHLLEDGIKNGSEFDANTYFDALPHLSMQEGYELDYIYAVDFLGGAPHLLARPKDLPPYRSYKDLPEPREISEYLNHIRVEDVEQGYFEYAAFSIMARQFYLYWHANYNDTEVVCSSADVEAIIARINDGDFGSKFDLKQQTQAAALRGIEPVVRLTEKTAIVEMVTFTKWGGFFRETFTILRAFPHTILDVQSENLVPYDCGVMF